MTDSTKTATTPCQICNSPNAPLYATKDGLCLYKCESCGLVYLDPMLSLESASNLYSDAYCGTTTGYFAKADKKLRRARRLLKKIRNKASGNKFLDVGCNGGFTMEAARETGFAAHVLSWMGPLLTTHGKIFLETTIFKALFSSIKQRCSLMWCTVLK